MTTRKLAAATTGPCTIDASLLGHGGVISVQTKADCDRATLTISTTDNDGPAAEAVRQAALRQSATGLNASVHGSGGFSGGGTTVISSGGRGTTVVQSVDTVTGTMVGIQGGVIDGSDVYINDVRVPRSNTGAVKSSSPVAITAVVPSGSKVIGHTQSAHIEAIGSFALVSAHTQSGDVRVEDAEKVTASAQSGSVTVGRAAEIGVETVSGGIVLNITDVVDANSVGGSIDIRDFGGTARLETMSGSIRVHATAGGDIVASTMSGSIDVTATQAALDDDLNVQTDTMSGRVRVPQRRPGGPGPRRRR